SLFNTSLCLVCDNSPRAAFDDAQRALLRNRNIHLVKKRLRSRLNDLTTGSKKQWNRKYQIFSRNCALQERCGFQVLEKLSVRRFPVLARSMKWVTN
ncbi:hypothetical protein GBF38_008346, partial [Nibea albiflora]